MKKANPNGGGMMLPVQSVPTIPTYPVRAPTVPSQFIPMNPIPLQQVLAPQTQVITYPVDEPPKTTFFEQKVMVLVEVDNNLLSEVGQMKKTMSQMNNELIRLKLSQGQNNNFQRNNVGPYNKNFGQNYNRNFNNNSNNNNARNNNGRGNNFNPPNHKNGFQRQN